MTFTFRGWLVPSRGSRCGCPGGNERLCRMVVNFDFYTVLCLETLGPKTKILKDLMILILYFLLIF